MLPIEAKGTPLAVPPTRSATFVITVGTLLVNVSVVAHLSLIHISEPTRPY